MTLTQEVLAQLSADAAYHQVPLRVPPEFYDELWRYEPPEPPFGRPVPETVSPPVGTSVVVVYDDSENVMRTEDGTWAFIPGRARA